MQTHKEILLLILFITVGVLTRTTLHIAPNVEFVTGVTLASAYFFTNKKMVTLVPVLILLLTDIIIGNTLIYLFTWSAFLIIPFFSFIAKRFEPKFQKLLYRFNLLIVSELLGIASTMVFFLWTNFGVVVTTEMYEKNIFGLTQSYINALPFLRNQLLGNLIIVPIIFFATSYLYKKSIVVSDKMGKQVVVEVNKG